MIPDIAIGAIAAAIIGALISLVGLIVSKEAKVSEFRQGWIDSLRTELSAFLTNANAVMDMKSLTIKDDAIRFEKAQPYFGKLNEAYYLIALRLNSKEVDAKELQTCMVSIAAAVKSQEPIDARELDKLRVNFINCSNALLKAEWTRVKGGELTFKVTKWLACAAIVALVILIGVAVSGKINRRPLPVPATKIATAPKPRSSPILKPIKPVSDDKDSDGSLDQRNKH